MRAILAAIGAFGISSAAFAAVLGSYSSESVSVVGNVLDTMPVQEGSLLPGVQLSGMTVGNPARRSTGHSTDSFSYSWGGGRNESLSFAITNNYYYQFTLTPEPDHSVSLSSFDFKMFLPERHISNTVDGVVFYFQPEFTLFSSATGGFTAGNEIATRLFAAPEISTADRDYNGAFDLGTIAALQEFDEPVTFRIYVHNTVARATYNLTTGGTSTRANGYEPIGIGQGNVTAQTDAFVVNGSVAAIPEPAIASIVVFACGASLLRRRRG